MGMSFESALGLAAAVGLVAGVVALSLSVLRIGLLSRSMRRATDQIEDDVEALAFGLDICEVGEQIE